MDWIILFLKKKTQSKLKKIDQISVSGRDRVDCNLLSHIFLSLKKIQSKLNKKIKCHCQEVIEWIATYCAIFSFDLKSPIKIEKKKIDQISVWGRDSVDSNFMSILKINSKDISDLRLEISYF